MEETQQTPSAHVGRLAAQAMDYLQAEASTESHLDALITRRHDQRVKDEGERAGHDLWQESVERYNAKRQAELTFEWVAYHEEAACRALANGEAIAARHRAQIEALLSGATGQSGENG